MTRPKPNTVILAVVAATAPVLTAIGGIYHERNEAADRQARRDEAILAALMDCIRTRHEVGAPKPSPPPYPLPAPTTIPEGEVLKLEALKGKPYRAASRILDAIAKNHGWEEK